jgi:aminoglycoside 6'-N-acetyltransferase
MHDGTMSDMTQLPEDPLLAMTATHDGLPIAADDPRGTTVVVRRPGTAGWEYLVLHRAHQGADYAGDWAWTAPAGARLPGEPIEPAALRELAEETGIVETAIWPVDLSGTWAVFAVDVAADTPVTIDAEHDRFRWLTADEAVTRILPASVAEQIRRVDLVPSVRFHFSPMAEDDIPAVAQRLAQPHVQAWYRPEEHTLERLQDEYGAAIRGEDPTRMWIVEVDGHAIGQVQDYRVGDHPAYAAATGMPDAVGIDFAITDHALTGRGIGTRMLWRFIRDVVWLDYDTTSVVSSPHPDNLASLRTLEKVGFVAGDVIETPGSDPERLCTLDLTRLFG